MQEQTPLPSLPDERPQRRREYSGPASTLGLAALIILVVGAGIWWFELRGPSSEGVQPPGLGVVSLPGSLNPTGRPPSPEPGRAAPDFLLATPAGDVLGLSELRGKYVLVNFWASWCNPCRGETPDLQRLYERQGERLVVLGVNQQEAAAVAQAFLEEFSVTYPAVLDRDGEVNLAYRVTGLPISVLVDPAGIVVRVYFGRLSEEDLAALEAEYLQ
jgi:thiol-disulfide isomerase/thioredoxin